MSPGVVGIGTRGAGEAPGGNPDNFGTQTPQISANGRSYTGNTVFVDGMNVTSPFKMETSFCRRSRTQCRK